MRGAMLELTSVTRNDMGTYMCIAKNGVPPATSKTFKLIVNFKPQIEVPNQVVGAPIGTEIILSCQIEASPKPITYWSKSSGEMIVPSSRHNISEVTLSNYQYTSTLYMKSIRKEDFTD